MSRSSTNVSKKLGDSFTPRTTTASGNERKRETHVSSSSAVTCDTGTGTQNSINSRSTGTNRGTYFPVRE